MLRYNSCQMIKLLGSKFSLSWDLIQHIVPVAAAIVHFGWMELFSWNQITRTNEIEFKLDYGVGELVGRSGHWADELTNTH